jgi:hypothetical protein
MNVIRSPSTSDTPADNSSAAVEQLKDSIREFAGFNAEYYAVKISRGTFPPRQRMSPFAGRTEIPRRCATAE